MSSNIILVVYETKETRYELPADTTPEQAKALVHGHPDQTIPGLKIFNRYEDSHVKGEVYAVETLENFTHRYLPS